MGCEDFMNVGAVMNVINFPSAALTCEKVYCAGWVTLTLTCLRGTLGVIVDVTTNTCDFPIVIGLIVSCENADFH